MNNDLSKDEEVVHKLFDRGFSPNEISDITLIPTDVIKVVLKTTEAPLPTEEELRERSLRLANEAITESFRILRFGTAAQKQSLIRALISNASKTLAKDSAADMADLRLALERLLGQNTAADVISEVPSIVELDPPTS